MGMHCWKMWPSNHDNHFSVEVTIANYNLWSGAPANFEGWNLVMDM